MTIGSNPSIHGFVEDGTHSIPNLGMFTHSRSVDYPAIPMAYQAHTACNGAVCGTIGCEHSIQECEERCKF